MASILSRAPKRVEILYADVINPCPRCGEIEIEERINPEGCVHYGAFICTSCGCNRGWMAKPAHLKKLSNYTSARQLALPK